VMVWIHGGGLRVGSACEPIYNGEEIANKGIVVVTLNYRLGVFGFFAHPELTKESPHHASGNYGLLDQLAALQWVQRNIAAFGGDPDKVTIFGQSGGAFSVNSQVATPLSKGLFRAAISESGAIRMGRRAPALSSLEESERGGIKLGESVGVHSLAELRALPAEKLLQANGAVGPNVDGWFFPQDIETLYKDSKQNKVPMLLGSNSDEAQHMIRTALASSEFRARTQKNYGNDADKFLGLYPGDSDQDAKISQQQMMADSIALAERNLAGYVVQDGAKAYQYYFTYLDTGGYNSEPPTLGLILGADHGAELPYIFGLLNHWKAKVPESDLKMQDLMMAYWTNFAKTMDPNGPGLPVWRPFSSSSNEVMVLDERAGMQPHPHAARLDFLQMHPSE
jgi:para-nitrobenzyl esterase